jgi:hypothetical protein
MYRMIASGNALLQLGLSNLSAPFWTKEDARSAMLNAIQRVRDNARHGVGGDEPGLPRLPQHVRVNLVDEIESYLGDGAGGDFHNGGEYADDFRSTEAEIRIYVVSVGSDA